MARTIRTKIYKFNELSKQAKQTAINWWKEGETFDWIYEEAWESLKVFCEVFEINMRDYDFNEPYRSHYTFEADEAVLELTGQRLATYIWNNYRTKIYKGKYYSLDLDKQVSHKRVKSERLTRQGRHKDWFNAYYSAINIERGNCPFTGVCYDEDLLYPIHTFCDKPNDNTTFKELLEDCLSSLSKSVEGEIKGSCEDANVIDTITANEYEFKADGTRY